MKNISCCLGNTGLKQSKEEEKEEENKDTVWSIMKKTGEREREEMRNWVVEMLGVML